MTDFNYVRCDFCGKEVRRNGHYRILEGWLRIDCQSRGLDGEMCPNPCQVDVCPDCVRGFPVLMAIYNRTRDAKADMMVTARGEWSSDAELLTWVNTWLDSARFDTDLTEEEQDACWTVLSAVARLQEGSE